MLISLLLQFIWLGIYLKSPYLFLGMAAIPYYFELDQLLGTSLEPMTAFPLSCYYVLQELRAGRKPDHPELITIEFIRWFIVMLIGNPDSHRLVMSGYCYAALMMIMLEGLGVSASRQSEVKYAWYLLWTGCLLCSSSFLAVALHLLNFITEFRLTSFLGDSVGRAPRRDDDSRT
jgi:hypothetical protein